MQEIRRIEVLLCVDNENIKQILCHHCSPVDHPVSASSLIADNERYGMENIIHILTLW